MKHVMRSALLSVCTLLACAPERVDLARFGEDADVDASVEVQDASMRLDAGSTSDAEVDAGQPGRSCDVGDSSACAEDQFCEVSGCGVKRGVCSQRPFCGARQDPVCGCDGVFYLNDCLRRQKGVALDPFCMLKRCGGGLPPCPSYALCFREGCGRTSGTCWVVPEDCGLGLEGGTRFDACDGSAFCVSLCDAISSEKSYSQPLQRCRRSSPTDPTPGP